MIMRKYSIVRMTGQSSNGESIIDLDILARRVSLTPLYASSRVKPYRGFGCCYSKCPFPNRTCNVCLHRFRKDVVF